MPILSLKKLKNFHTLIFSIHHFFKNLTVTKLTIADSIIRIKINNMRKLEFVSSVQFRYKFFKYSIIKPLMPEFHVLPLPD